MTRVLDPLSAQLPAADPITATVATASPYRPLVMRGAPVAETIHVPTAPQVAWNATLQLPADQTTGQPQLSRTNGTTSTTSANDSSSPDTDTDASDD